MTHAKQLAGLTGVLVATIGLVAGFTAEAAQESGVDTHSVTVRYDDLDLTREAGVRALYGRLVTAANRACGRYDPRRPRERRIWSDCFAAALATAVDGFGSAKLAALHGSDERAVALPARIAARPQS